METINFKDLYSTDFHLEKVFAMHQHWNENHIFSTENIPRRTSAILYLNNCNCTYNLNDHSTLQAPKGSLLYIPQGSLYQTVFTECSDTKITSTLIEFEIKNSSAATLTAANKVMILDEAASPLVVSMLNELVNLYVSPLISYAAFKAVLYKLLCDYSCDHYKKNIYSKEFVSISDGILYMEKNINYVMSIEQIANMCHVSTSTFRRIFKAYSGMSPVEFKNNSLVEYAKKLLQSGTLSVSEIASMLKFDDAAYFCRLFKKKTGYTPTEYADAYFNKVNLL